MMALLYRERQRADLTTAESGSLTLAVQIESAINRRATRSYLRISGYMN